MIIDTNENVSIITQEKATVIELVKKMQALYPKFKTQHIIVRLSGLDKLVLADVIEFLQISNNHRATKKSFVIVNDSFNSDETPDKLVVVPTIQEAYDIIEMEDIERDLGF